MSSEMMHKVLRMIDAEAQSRPGVVDYELAYQARVAIDRIRFAIRQTEEFAPRTDRCMRSVFNCSMHWTGSRAQSGGFSNAFVTPQRTASLDRLNLSNAI